MFCPRPKCKVGCSQVDIAADLVLEDWKVGEFFDGCQW